MSVERIKVRELVRALRGDTSLRTCLVEMLDRKSWQGFEVVLRTPENELLELVSSKEPREVRNLPKWGLIAKIAGRRVYPTRCTDRDQVLRIARVVEWKQLVQVGDFVKVYRQVVRGYRLDSCIMLGPKDYRLEAPKGRSPETWEEMLQAWADTGAVRAVRELVRTHSEEYKGLRRTGVSPRAAKKVLTQKYLLGD